ncbi:MAG: purine nucleoside permease [Woeseiaceae bacterium]
MLIQACSVDVDVSADGEARIAPKVVVVAMFERGEVRGDEAGELQLWVERLGLDTEIEFALGVNSLYMNDDGVMAILVGGGIPNAAASIMALGLDERFDLTQSYWLVAGIAGADPEDLSLGSAAWANHVVDGDLLYEIDGREIPEDWPYGMVPLGGDRPTTDPDDLANTWTAYTIAFTLNKNLVDWAYSITKDVALEDAPGITAYRANYETYPEAQRPPFVTIGDTMSSSTYWHGNFMNQWANDWVKLYRGEAANFMTSNMEDSGTLTSLTRLSNVGRVDIDRVLVLRTASNFTMPPAGKTAVWSRDQPYPDGGKPSFEAAFVVGNTVVQALLDGWAEYQETIPQAAAQ